MSGWKRVNMDMDRVSPDYIVRDAIGGPKKDRWGFTESRKPKAPLRKHPGRRYGVPWLDAWLAEYHAERGRSGAPPRSS